ncbi:helix-turn-helix domain-containing protein [Levilactobacillus fujinensis]|uniref:Helix-turn-helix domain-containing protein n=1 Tax=Levilactobacillus fujinensis TaxID=2486024 RepID=A0ABW1TIJ6_9LACO|nr:helix-turn-helix domain-containing protein [Levilactobacillus fujinensis]
MTIDNAAAYKFLFTGDHETMLYGVLKKLNLKPGHPDYEDYFQEARVLFPDIYHAFPEDPEEKPHQFLAYAQQKLYWTLMDQRRHDFRDNSHQESGDGDTLLSGLPDDDDVLAAIGLADYRKYLLKLIGASGKAGEWHFLVGTLVDQLTVDEIAAKHQVSRNTVYRWRRLLTQRLIHHLTADHDFLN